MIRFFLRISPKFFKNIKIKDITKHIYTNICLVKFIKSPKANEFFLKIKRSLNVVEIESQHIA